MASTVELAPPLMAAISSDQPANRTHTEGDGSGYMIEG
jgi:hypothetical protein